MRMKCDLHVHTIHSGMCTVPVLKHICRESYNDPQEVYAVLKSKGMDLVTLTDHDSIGGAESLRGHVDFFLSEEVTCRMPSGTTVHVGVFDLTERQHLEIQRRRDDFICLLAYLTERRLLFSINHIFSSLTGRRASDDFAWVETYVPALETHSGQMSAFHNRQAAQLAGRLGKTGLGGSDSHTLPSLGTAYTEVPGARSKEEFLAGLKAKNAVASGSSGGYFRLTRDVLWITAKMFQERPWTLLFSPMTVLVPAVIAAMFVDEMRFARRWSARVNLSDERRGESMESLMSRPAEVCAWP
jgi:predicted metal-dependent phosphoesterase TrpH